MSLRDTFLFFVLVVGSGVNPLWEWFYSVPTGICYVFWLIVCLVIARPSRQSRNWTLLYGILILIVVSSVSSKLTLSLGMISRIFKYLSLAVMGFVVAESLSAQAYLSLKRVGYYLVLLSFLFWLPAVVMELLGIDLESAISDVAFRTSSSDIGKSSTAFTHLVVHNFRGYANPNYAFLRNSGVFWEPGAFGGFLTMLMLLSLKISGPRSIFEKETLFIFLGILSTMSTTSIVIALVVILYHSGSTIRFGVERNVLVPLLLILSVIFFLNAPFLLDKILAQNEMVFGGSKWGNATRFGQFFIGIDLWMEAPLFGHGFGSSLFESVYFNTLSKEMVSAFGNGLTLMLVYGGILLTWISVRAMSNSIIVRRGIGHQVFAIFVVLAWCSGQAWFNHLCFYFLIFAGHVYDKRVTSGVWQGEPDKDLYSGIAK